ncbi:hypothetical protein STEG23_024295, partial [Scotinomys teguina]
MWTSRAATSRHHEAAAHSSALQNRMTVLVKILHTAYALSCFCLQMHKDTTLLSSEG